MQSRRNGAHLAARRADSLSQRKSHRSTRISNRIAPPQARYSYLECGIFAHGFACARCDDCGHNYVVAFSCKGRGVCPSCNTWRIVQTAVHLSDHIFPRLTVRQLVLLEPEGLRYFMMRDGVVLNRVLRIFLRVIAQSLSANSPGAANVDKTALHIGAVAFIHRFGSILNEHVHFRDCMVDRGDGIPLDFPLPGICDLLQTRPWSHRVVRFTWSPGMAAVEKLAGFREGQLFSKRTQIYVFF